MPERNNINVMVSINIYVFNLTLMNWHTLRMWVKDKFNIIIKVDLYNTNMPFLLKNYSSSKFRAVWIWAFYILLLLLNTTGLLYLWIWSYESTTVEYYVEMFHILLLVLHIVLNNTQR